MNSYRVKSKITRRKYRTRVIIIKNGNSKAIGGDSIYFVKF